MDTCGALDASETETLYYCTLAAGHPDNGDGTITHECDYRETDPNNPPMTIAASHTWTVPV